MASGRVKMQYFMQTRRRSVFVATKPAQMRPKAALLALCAALLLQQAAAFIRVVGTSFADEECREFAFVGATT